MKHVKLIRILALLLTVVTVLTAVGCGVLNQQPAPSTGNNQETEAYAPDIPIKNYDCDFNIVIGGTYTRDSIAIEDAENAKAGDLEAAVYERGIKIKDHLGVNLVHQDAGDWISYASNVSKTVKAGDDSYQLVLTHVYQGLTDLVTSNALYDMGELEAIHLDAPYWASDLMEEVKIDDKYLLGYGDMCLSTVKVVVFNKDLMSEYNMVEPYQDVRDKKWTLDQLISMASVVSADDGDGRWTEKDTYGISGWGWVPLISFVTSSNMKIVDRDENGDFVIAYDRNNEKMLKLLEKVMGMYNADYSYFWKSTSGTPLNFADGNSLFQLYESTQLTLFRNEDIRFGVLPYPLWDEAQPEYKSLNWNGMMCVPGSIKNPEMVGEVLELMNYYSADVKVAYYEKLLGSKLAEAPDDAEMLEIVWNSQVSDVGLITCNSSSSMDSLVYLVPKICESGRNNYASYLRTNSRGAQLGLDNVFKQK